jgi:hypothetical protein
MDTRTLWRYILSPFVIGGSVVLGIVLLCGVLIMLMVTRPEPGSASQATAIVHVIPLPSPTPTVPTPTPAPEATPTSVGPPPPQSGPISIGAFVQVTGTGGDGLRLRSEPGLNGVVRFLGLEAEVFQVSDGPRQADGYTWWFLVAPYDPTVQGWAVTNFMVVVQQP